MSKTDKIEQQARALCNHTVVFTDPEDKMIATMAIQGLTTKSIAAELGVSVSIAQYRIQKAQNSLGVRFRADIRNGRGKLARKMLKANERIAMRVVEEKIAPLFIPFARQGVGRLT